MKLPLYVSDPRSTFPIGGMVTVLEAQVEQSQVPLKSASPLSLSNTPIFKPTQPELVPTHPSPPKPEVPDRRDEQIKKWETDLADRNRQQEAELTHQTQEKIDRENFDALEQTARALEGAQQQKRDEEAAAVEVQGTVNEKEAQSRAKKDREETESQLQGDQLQQARKSDERVRLRREEDEKNKKLDDMVDPVLQKYMNIVREKREKEALEVPPKPAESSQGKEKEKVKEKEKEKEEEPKRRFSSSTDAKSEEFISEGV